LSIFWKSNGSLAVAKSWGGYPRVVSYNKKSKSYIPFRKFHGIPIETHENEAKSVSFSDTIFFMQRFRFFSKLWS